MDFDPRDSDSRDRERDEDRERTLDSRDVFTRDMNLPRGHEREIVRYRDREYTLRGSESRTLTTVGSFRVVSSRDLRDGRDRELNSRSGDLRHLREQGLVETVRIGAHARRTGALLGRWQEADHVGSAELRERLVERCDLSGILPRQTKQVPIRDLFGNHCCAHLRQDHWRNYVGPPDVFATRRRQQQQPIRGRFRRPGTAGKLGTNTDGAELRDGARCPPVHDSFGGEPLLGSYVVRMLGHQQCDEHVHVEERDHT